MDLGKLNKKNQQQIHYSNGLPETASSPSRPNVNETRFEVLKRWGFGGEGGSVFGKEKED